MHNKQTELTEMRKFHFKVEECKQIYTFLLTLNDSSKFSPPHISIPESYFPRWLKYSRLIANKPPAMVGDLKNRNMTNRENKWIQDQCTLVSYQLNNVRVFFCTYLNVLTRFVHSKQKEILKKIFIASQQDQLITCVVSLI